jgi:hypothetical protein
MTMRQTHTVTLIRSSFGGPVGLLVIPKSKHANKIWLSIGSCLKIGHFDQNYSKLL